MELNLIEQSVSIPPTKKDGEAFIVFCEGIGFVYARYYTGSKTWMSNETKNEIKPTFWYKKKKHYSEFPKGSVLDVKSFSEQIESRRSGNTTREIDTIVNLLFNEYKVYCAFQNDTECSVFLNKVIDRFKIEHKLKTTSSDNLNKTTLTWDFYEKIKIGYKIITDIRGYLIFNEFGNEILKNEKKLSIIFELITKENYEKAINNWERKNF